MRAKFLFALQSAVLSLALLMKNFSFFRYNQYRRSWKCSRIS